MERRKKDKGKITRVYVVVCWFLVGALLGWGIPHSLQKLDREAVEAQRQVEQRELYEAKVKSLEAAMIAVTKYLNQTPHVDQY